MTNLALSSTTWHPVWYMASQGAATFCEAMSAGCSRVGRATL